MERELKPKGPERERDLPTDTQPVTVRTLSSVPASDPILWGARAVYISFTHSILRVGGMPRIFSVHIFGIHCGIMNKEGRKS